VRGQRRQLEEGAAGVQQGVDPIAGQQLPAGDVPLPGPLAAAGGHGAQLLGQVGDQGRVGGGVAGGRAGVGGRRADEHRGIHGTESTTSPARM
jgi:hypothetical protein